MTCIKIWNFRPVKHKIPKILLITEILMADLYKNIMNNNDFNGRFVTCILKGKITMILKRDFLSKYHKL